MSQAAVKLVEPVTLPPLTPSSTSQRRLCAGVVVKTVLTVPTFAVIVCVSGVTARIRGPRPPAGLTISAAWVISRVRASSCQRTRNVTRRKSSPLASAPAGAGDAGVGGRRRPVAVGWAVEDARRRGDGVVDAAALDRPGRARAEAARLQLRRDRPDVLVVQLARGLDELAREVRRGDTRVARGGGLQRAGVHPEHGEDPRDEQERRDHDLDHREAVLAAARRGRGRRSGCDYHELSFRQPPWPGRVQLRRVPEGPRVISKIVPVSDILATT